MSHELKVEKPWYNLSNLRQSMPVIHLWNKCKSVPTQNKLQKNSGTLSSNSITIVYYILKSSEIKMETKVFLDE